MLTLPKQALDFVFLQHKFFENTAGKGEIAPNEQFHLFPQCFLPFWRTFRHFNQLEFVICRLSQFERVKNLLFGKGLNRVNTLLNDPVFYSLAIFT